MEHYSFLRTLADSWGVLGMLTVFLIVCVWALRPGSRALHDDAAQSIFRHDENHPDAGSDPARSTQNRKEA
ncbi:MAG: cbb3-type cytochrome c oxidase subunit 3 [Paracoccaceae bacterium]